MSLLEMEGIRKSFYGVEVLHCVQFELQTGSVHALMGENGAGKSTLMKILAGIYSRDSGVIRIDNQEKSLESPTAAQKCGVAMIHQELSAVREMTVAENIFLGREPGKKGVVDGKKLYAQTEELLNSLNIPISPKAKMGKLRMADQQMVEIAKALSQNARILVMDEPTSSITDREVEKLFNMIRDLKKRGTGIIYISHKMDEIFEITDEITVLRDGCSIDHWKTSEVTQEMLIKSMVGRELKEQFPKAKVPIGETVLEVKNLTRNGQFENISFQLHRGEILGLVGLVGAGRTETMQALFGLTKPDAGQVVLNGKPVHIKSPKDAIHHGIAFVTEDRKGEGLVLPMSLYHNTTLSSLPYFEKAGMLQKGKEKRAVHGQIEQLHIKAANITQAVNSLSGGNQQKVVLAKWMLTKPKIIIFDEPTRGIDVGAKAEIYRLMGEYVGQGHAIIMISSEMPEAMGMSDRILVLSNHQMAGELSREEFSQEKIMKLAVSCM